MAVMVFESCEVIMPIGSVTTTPVQSPLKSLPVEATEATRGGKDAKNDGDADDAVAVGKASAPKPTLNFQGQEIGKTLNVAV